ARIKPFVIRGVIIGLGFGAAITGARLVVEGFDMKVILRDCGVGVGVGTAVGLCWYLFHAINDLRRGQKKNVFHP
ncbi:MAG: hypothetical protein ACYC4B_31320, partial [Pirellulaceae bacterium]